MKILFFPQAWKMFAHFLHTHTHTEKNMSLKKQRLIDWTIQNKAICNQKKSLVSAWHEIHPILCVIFSIASSQQKIHFSLLTIFVIALTKLWPRNRECVCNSNLTNYSMLVAVFPPHSCSHINLMACISIRKCASVIHPIFNRMVHCEHLELCHHSSTLSAPNII